MAIDKIRFNRIKEALYTRYNDMNEISWVIYELNNDDSFPKDRWIEEWHEIIRFILDNNVTDEPDEIEKVHRWAEMIGEPG